MLYVTRSEYFNDGRRTHFLTKINSLCESYDFLKFVHNEECLKRFANEYIDNAGGKIICVTLCLFIQYHRENFNSFFTNRFDESKSCFDALKKWKS